MSMDKPAVRAAFEAFCAAHNIDGFGAFFEVRETPDGYWVEFCATFATTGSTAPIIAESAAIELERAARELRRLAAEHPAADGWAKGPPGAALAARNKWDQ